MPNEMRDRLRGLLLECGVNINTTSIADHLIENGVTFKQVVYFPFPIDCERCPNALSAERCCEEMELLYDGKHPKYTKTQDWDLMLEICPREITSREYREKDDANEIGKTMWFTKEQAEQKLQEMRGGNDL